MRHHGADATVTHSVFAGTGGTTVIVWVNGPFGGGKSTLVEELRPRWPEALVFDPEMVGYVLREIVDVPTGDFQDLPCGGGRSRTWPSASSRSTGARFWSP